MCKPNDIAIPGRGVLVHKADGGEDYQSLGFIGMTWGDVLVFFEEAIKKTQNYEHVWLEGVRKVEPEKVVCLSGLEFVVYEFDFGGKR
jgi:hypothetical protein